VNIKADGTQSDHLSKNRPKSAEKEKAGNKEQKTTQQPSPVYTAILSLLGNIFSREIPFKSKFSFIS
jgi:hypothetical protein